MKQSTLDYAKLLTELDNKTLTERVAKLFEEGGELSKKIQPYDNVSATRHRFIGKGQILEEVADSMLVLLSIAYQLGYDDSDIDEKLQDKAKVWDSLLQKERLVADKPIPYEIHITVTTDDIPGFVEYCKEINVKPIVLELQLSNGGTMQDVMTSSVVLGDNKKAYEEAQLIGDQLKGRGFNVVRIKVETVPWHPAAPSDEGDRMPKDCYFESHVAAISTVENRETLVALAEKYDAHMSKNVFKTIDEASFVQMMTIRWYDGIYSEFSKSVDKFIQALGDNDISVEKKIVEFSICDMNINHDSAWISK